MKTNDDYTTEEVINTSGLALDAIENELAKFDITLEVEDNELMIDFLQLILEKYIKD